jgi:hypothetical protein
MSFIQISRTICLEERVLEKTFKHFGFRDQRCKEALSNSKRTGFPIREDDEEESDRTGLLDKWAGAKASKKRIACKYED